MTRTAQAAKATEMQQGCVTLRRLTEKSKLGFGKYETCTVGEVADVVENGMEYLRWVYYNMSGIDFIPEILEKIGIVETIPKPGVDPELFDELRNALRQKEREEYNASWEDMDEDEKKLRRYKLASIRKRKNISAKMKARDKKANFDRKTSLSKAQLQAINHGHAKY